MVSSLTNRFDLQYTEGQKKMQEPQLTDGSIFVQSRNLTTYVYVINPNTVDNSSRHAAKKDKLYKLLCLYCSPKTQIEIAKALDTHTPFLLDVEKDQIFLLHPDFELSRQQHKLTTLESMRKDALNEEIKHRAKTVDSQVGKEDRVTKQAEALADSMWKVI